MFELSVFHRTDCCVRSPEAIDETLRLRRLGKERGEDGFFTLYDGTVELGGS